MKQLLTACMLAVCASAGAADLEFKGAPFGMTIQEFAARFKEFSCGNNFCSKYAREQFTYGGLRVINAHAAFCDDGMCEVRIAFDPAGFVLLEDAYKAKYGAVAAYEESEVVTGAGVKLGQRIARWKVGESIITLRKYTASSAIGEVVLQSPSGMARAAAELDQMKKKAKSDI